MLTLPGRTTFYRVILVLIFGPASSWAAETETVTVSRHFTFTTCDTSGKCSEQIAERSDTDVGEAILTLLPSGKVAGLDAWDRNKVIIGDIVFQSEIHLIKYDHTGAYRYYLYAMLRSGRRHGKTRKIRFNDFSTVSRVVLADMPIHARSGTLQARLVFGLRQSP